MAPGEMPPVLRVLNHAQRRDAPSFRRVDLRIIETPVLNAFRVALDQVGRSPDATCRALTLLLSGSKGQPGFASELHGMLALLCHADRTRADVRAHQKILFQLALASLFDPDGAVEPAHLQVCFAGRREAYAPLLFDALIGVVGSANSRAGFDTDALATRLGVLYRSVATRMSDTERRRLGPVFVAALERFIGADPLGIRVRFIARVVGAAQDFTVLPDTAGVHLSELVENAHVGSDIPMRALVNALPAYRTGLRLDYPMLEDLQRLRGRDQDFIDDLMLAVIERRLDELARGAHQADTISPAEMRYWRVVGDKTLWRELWAQRGRLDLQVLHSLFHAAATIPRDTDRAARCAAAMCASLGSERPTPAVLRAIDAMIMGVIDALPAGPRREAELRALRWSINPAAVGPTVLARLYKPIDLRLHPPASDDIPLSR